MQEIRGKRIIILRGIILGELSLRLRIRRRRFMRLRILFNIILVGKIGWFKPRAKEKMKANNLSSILKLLN